MDDTKTVEALCSELETDPSTMDGGVLFSKLSGKEKEVPMKACNTREEVKECAFGGVNDEETANAEVTNEEHMIEEIEEGKQVKAIANKNANKSTKKGRKVKAKTKVATRRKPIAKITSVQEPSDKGMEEEADSVAGGEENKLMKQDVEEENTNDGMTIKEDAEVSISVGAVEHKEEVNNNDNAGVVLANEKNVEVVVNNGGNAGEDVVKAASINEVVKGEHAEPVPENEKKVEFVVNNGENAGEDVIKAASINEVVKGEEVKPMPENPVNKSRKARLRNKKKNTLNGTAAVVPKNGKEPESSEKKTSKTMGMIFMCSSKTKKDCYQYRVLGLPASKRDLVLNTVFAGMKLFLFDVDLKLLYGIYKAASPGGYNIEPKAFKAAFPSQVRFAVHDDCLPIPEEKFRSVIKDNYYQKNKFSCELTSEQVKNLCKLFQNASKILKPKQVLRAESRKAAGKDKIRKPRNARAEDSFPIQDRSRKRLREAGRAETHTFVDRETSRKRRRGLEKHPAYGRDRVYSNGLDAYERRVRISTLPPIPLHPPLPAPISAPALPPRYAYERDAEMNIPRRPLLVERHDRHYLDSDSRRQQHVDYGREALDSYRDRWYHDVEPRRLDEPYSYYSQRERRSYYDQVNSAAPSSSYYPSSGISRDNAALPPEYQPLPDYQPLPSNYRY